MISNILASSAPNLNLALGSFSERSSYNEINHFCIQFVVASASHYANLTTVVCNLVKQQVRGLEFVVGIHREICVGNYWSEKLFLKYTINLTWEIIVERQWLSLCMLEVARQFQSCMQIWHENVGTHDRIRMGNYLWETLFLRSTV